MINHTLFPVVAVALSALTLTTQIHAQSPLVTIDTVTVGDPGNAADTSGFGAVDSTYSISKYETTISQYTTFLNSVVTGLWKLDHMRVSL